MNRYYQIRAIGTIIALIFILFANFPVQMLIATIFLGFVFLIARAAMNRNYTNNGEFTDNADNGAYRRRIEALRSVEIYLAPYTSVWRNLVISNKYCTLRLGYDGKTIRGIEKVAPYSEFRIVESQVYDYTTLWDMFCISFNHNTTFNGLLEQCNRYRAVYEIIYSQAPTSAPVIKIDTTKEKQEKSIAPIEKLDINNASEVEITALPGISIVMSKKLIKKREEIGGFKSIDDVFLFLHLKEHFQEQLRDRICVKKMKGSIKIDHNQERQVDL